MQLPEARPRSPDARGLLLTAPYLAAVALLVLNDHWWKRAVPGLVTRKLLDFARIFAVAVFAAAFRPRWSLQVCTAVGSAFFLGRRRGSRRSSNGGTPCTSIPWDAQSTPRT